MSALILAGALAALVACGGRSAERGVALPAEYRGQAAVLSPDGVAAMLPADTLLVVAARSPRALADAFGFPDVLREYRAQGSEAASLYHDVAAEAEALFGANILRADELSRVGIDPDAPFGVALLDGEWVGLVLFATVADSDRLELAVHGSLAKVTGPLEPRRMGSALALVPTRRPTSALVLRDSQAFFVIPGERKDLGPLTARLALGRGEGTLASDEAFVRAFERFDFGAEVAGYLALPNLASRLEHQRARFAEELRHYEEMEQRRLEAELAESPEQADPQRVEAIRAQLDRGRSMEDARGRLSRDVLAAIGGVAFGVALDGPIMRIRLAARPRPGSLPDRLLRPGAAPPALLAARPDLPLFALGAHTNPEQLRALLDLLLAVDGGGLGELARELREHTGVDLDAEVVPLLSGELGVATHGDPNDLSGQTVLVGVADPAAAGALLGRAAAGPLARFARTDPKGVGLSVPGGGDRQVHVDLAGDQLVMSDDPETAARVTARAAGFAATLPERARALLDDPRAHGVLVLDPTALGWMFGSSSYGTAQVARAVAAEADDDPRAREIEQQLRELDRRRWRAQQALDDAWARLTARQLGPTVLALHRHDDAVVALGVTLTPGETLAPAFQGLLELVIPNLVTRRTRRPAEIETLLGELSALEDERRALHRELRDRALPGP